jgi:hypothetical protein
MKILLNQILYLLLLPQMVQAQVQVENFSLSVYTGLVNYQGDLNPNSFTFNRSKPAFGLISRVKLNPHFTWRSGVMIGSIQAADRYNRDYLKPRNLSFNTNIKEIYSGLEVSLFNMEQRRVVPFAYGGLAIFHFNPWTIDQAGAKVYLQPLGTEGQGLEAYPGRKKYKLTQMAMAFGGGARVAVSEALTIGIEMSQRKTFTDYLDDVSTTYVDQQLLLAGNGPRAVELSYRGDELNNSTNYPPDKEIRGTPTEKDWYYYIGIDLAFKWQAIGSLFNNNSGKKDINHARCPRF